jgi:uncharacterized protein
VTPPRWLADEMVGRLARYLRFVGCDTEYVRGASDQEVLDRARREDRVILTRDRALAGRASAALLLTSPNLADQWKAVRRAYPEVPSQPRFERCTECNGRLEPFLPGPGRPRPEGVPWDRVERGLGLFRCSSCGHCYWEGSHTRSITERLSVWAKEASP